jgi:hypothetical protein
MRAGDFLNEGRSPEDILRAGDGDAAAEAVELCARKGRRWPAAEEFIANYPRPAFDYADEVIKGPWPEGERAIKRNHFCALYYAINLRKSRWPEAEDDIIADIDPDGGVGEIEHSLPLFCKYILEFKGGRWPAFEKLLLYRDDLDDIKFYIEEVIRGPWEQAEPLMVWDKFIWRWYALTIMGVSVDQAEILGNQLKAKQ